MTTTVSLDQSTTVETTVQETQTVIVQGVLDVLVTSTTSSSLSSSSITSEPSTISTIRSLSTLTALASSLSSSTVIQSSSSPSSLTSSANSGIRQFKVTNNTNYTNIGLVIGIPVAVIGVCLLIFGVWYYFHRKSNKEAKTSDMLKHYFHDEYKWKATPSPDPGSQYSFNESMRGVYKVRAKVPHNSAETLTENPAIYEKFANSEISLKDPHVDQVNSKWTLNSPLSKWFMNHTRVSSPTPRESIKVSPFSPVVALKEFKLHKSKRSEVVEKSPVSPCFPQPSYFPGSSHTMSHSVSIDRSETTNQTVPVNTETDSVPKLKLDKHRKAGPKNSKTKTLKRLTFSDKPLPSRPSPSNSSSQAITSASLKDFEKIVSQRANTTTPVVDHSKYKDENIYVAITNYRKALADELNINKGEHFKILASHTDGWCLVEKVDVHGSILLDNEVGHYINEGRGVVPEMCLAKLPNV